MKAHTESDREKRFVVTIHTSFGNKTVELQDPRFILLYSINCLNTSDALLEQVEKLEEKLNKALTHNRSMKTLLEEIRKDKRHKNTEFPEFFFIPKKTINALRDVLRSVKRAQKKSFQYGLASRHCVVTD